MAHLKTQFEDFNLKGGKADVYDYLDPVDHNESKNQGIRFVWPDGSRVVFRYT